MNVLQRNFIEKFLLYFVENIVTLDNQGNYTKTS